MPKLPLLELWRGTGTPRNVFDRSRSSGDFRASAELLAKNGVLEEQKSLRELARGAGCWDPSVYTYI